MNSKKTIPAVLPRRRISRPAIFIFSMVGLALVIAVGFWIAKSRYPEEPGFLPDIFDREPKPLALEAKVEKFKSEKDFKAYLEKTMLAGWGMLGGGGGAGEMMRLDLAPSEGLAPVGMVGEAPVRVAETTVQVKGIDEPDILKTDGQQIYFSPQARYYTIGRGPTFEEKIMPEPQAKTQVVKAFPPADLAKLTEIEKSGQLLLTKNMLVVFASPEIIGFDVSDPSSPQKKWALELENNNELVTARLYKEEIYLVTRQRINVGRPCPITPFAQGANLTVRCTDIYYPVPEVAVDVTYTAMTVDPADGEVKDGLSFVGASSSSIVYMSTGALYITYFYQGNIADFYYNFFLEKGDDLVPDWVMEKLAKLRGYEISDQSKLSEIMLILAQFTASLDDDERNRLNNELTNRMDDYQQEHQRELERTGIIKIGLRNFTSNLRVLASGDIPGQPLNQFSLDEYQGNLRIATTVGGSWWGLWGRAESANDVYVLDSNLDIIGSIKNLGLGERVYSARFIGNRGYLVTFRQIDPFFVLDLGEPRSPQLAGELKIPGYSSYLHPIEKAKILGIGKEETRVKVSLFDVSSPQNPAEAAKYLLDEYWSDILETHHAFLLDEKHKIFFLPGSKGGYVFSYQDDKLELKRSLAGIRARRATYINDYLYIVGDDQIVVLNEADWEEVNRIEL